MKILLTGGTGSFGKAFLNYLLKNHKSKVKRLVIFSRDELKQFNLKKQYPTKEYPFIRYFIGDVRDLSRLNRAIEGIDIVIHAAALKHISTAEKHPFEAIKTNILGTQNLIEASLDNGVKKLISLSTDKASSPINLYGATKLCADRLVLSSNFISGSRPYKASVVRYGNVFGSRGSIATIFSKIKDGIFPISDMEMTRFNISLDEAINFVYQSINLMKGGEIFVPKMKSFKITDLAKAFDNNAQFQVYGQQNGEKIHEELFNKEESKKTVNFIKSYQVFPLMEIDEFKKIKFKDGKKIFKPFNYISNENSYLNIEDLKKLIKKYNFD